MSGHQEGDQLVADVDRVQVRAEHELQQIIGCPAGHRAPGGDDLVGCRGEVPAVPTHLAFGQPLEEFRQRTGPGRAQQVAVFEPGHHVPDEGVHGVAVEQPERVSGRTPGDGLQGRPGGVGRHVDGAPPHGAVPSGEELAGDLEHGVVVAVHRRLGEGRHQEFMRRIPIGLIVVGGEQPVADDQPQRLHLHADVFAEPGLVVEFADDVGALGDHITRTERGEFEERPEAGGHPGQRLGGLVDVHREQVTENRQPSWRMRQLRNVGRFGPGGEAGHTSNFLRCCTHVK